MPRFFVALMVTVFITASEAGEVTILAGVTKFQPHDAGTWWADGPEFPHELKMTGQSFGIRYDTAKNDDVSYSVGFLNLGAVSSSAVASGIDGPTNHGYSPELKTCINGCGYLSHWYGNGNVRGVFATRANHFGNFAIEYGLYIYKPTWQVHIPDWRGICQECPTVDLTVTHNAKLQPTPMVGVRYRKGPWSLNLSTMQAQSYGDEWTSLYMGLAYNLSVGYTF